MLGPREAGDDLRDPGAPPATVVTELDAEPSARPEPTPVDGSERADGALPRQRAVPAGDPGVEGAGFGAAVRRRLLTWPPVAPTWLRAPLGVAAAVLVGGLVGALVASSSVERAQLAERQSTARLLATLTLPATGPVEDESGHGFQMELVVLNAGPEPVTVTEARVPGTQTAILLDESTRVSAGRSASIETTVVPDCSGRTAGDLTLLVQTIDGATREVAAGGLGRGLGLRPSQLGVYCRSGPEADPIPVWRTTVEDDGRLALQLRNTRPGPVQLAVGSPPGTHIEGNPTLPATLPTDHSLVVRLRLVVDRCTSAAQRADAGGQVELLVDGDPGVSLPDTSTLVGWFAQQVAVQCG